MLENIKPGVRELRRGVYGYSEKDEQEISQRDKLC